ncbi:MAG TPA: outer membrane lipoprotein carrier protein LolA [Rhizomicrobium sp.]
MRRRFSLLFLALAALGPALGAGQPASQALPNYSDAQNADLDRISTYLNRLKTLKAEFSQIDSNGDLTTGTFYLSRPGRLRFEYRPPSPTLVVASSGNIWVKNARLNTVDRYSLSDTPLELLLKDKVDLKRNRAIVGVDDADGAITVHARSSTNRVQGNITLVFDAGTLELRQWTVKDSQGLLTTVVLRNVQTGMALPDALFTAPQKNPPGKKGG